MSKKLIDHSHKISIFKDSEHTKEFQEQGFITVELLTPAEIKELNNLYRSIYPAGVSGFFTTTFENNVAHRENVNSSIQRVCKKRIEELFENYKFLFSSFIVKAPGKDSKLILHQDMTLVDESKYQGINIWCPLVDTYPENGAIRVLPKSHRLYNTYRGSSLPDIYDGLVDEVKSVMTTLSLKAGTAVIFDQSIIHDSPPNMSEEDRPVINTFVAHKKADLKICYWDRKKEPAQVEIFQQEDDFLTKYEQFGANIFERPNMGKSLGLFPYDFPKMNVQDLVDHYGYLPPVKQVEKNQSIFERLIFWK